MKIFPIPFIIKLAIIFIFIISLRIFIFNWLVKSPSIQKNDNSLDSQLSPTPITDKKGLECIKSGGDWTMGPLSKVYFCNKKFEDGSKPCKDSSECLSGKCIIYKGDSVAECVTHESVFGCYSILSKSKSRGRVKAGDISRQEICVD